MVENAGQEEHAPVVFAVAANVLKGQGKHWDASGAKLPAGQASQGASDDTPPLRKKNGSQGQAPAALPSVEKELSGQG